MKKIGFLLASEAMLQQMHPRHSQLKLKGEGLYKEKTVRVKRIFYLEGTKVGHKRSIMSNPSIDEDFIRSVYQDYLTKSEMDKNFIMSAIASNESCPTDIIQELSKSTYHLTKKIASETLRKKRRLESKLLKNYINTILG